MSVRITAWGGGGFMVDIRVRFSSGEKFRERRVYKMSRTSAERAAGKRHQFLIENDSADGPQEVMTLSAFWPRYEKLHIVGNNLKPTTVQSKNKTWRLYLGPILGKLKLTEITLEVVQELKSQLLSDDEAEGGRDLAPKTVNNVLADLSSMLTKASEWGDLGKLKPPVVAQLKLEDEGEMEFYQPAELEQLVAGAQRASEEAELVVLLGSCAGLRAGEMVALEWGDVDFARMHLKIRRGETIPGEVTSTKGNREREVPMTSRLFEALKAYRHLRGERVFIQNGGTNATLWWLRDKMESAQRLAGFAKATGGMHILRHTFCSILAMRGVAALAIKQLAGHKDLKTTMRYMHLAPGGGPLVDAIAALEAVETGATARQRLTKGKGPLAGALS